jgi:hypothetical protein
VGGFVTEILFELYTTATHHILWSSKRRKTFGFAEASALLYPSVLVIADVGYILFSP